MKINKEISTYFLTDAKDYLNRYQILKEKATHIGLRSKLLIELLFALECSLKSIIYLETNEDEKIIYGKLLSHNLDKLFNLLSENSKSEYKTLIKEDLHKFQVGIRYQLESEIDFRTEKGVLSEKYYNTIANFLWLDNIYNQVANFVAYIDKLNPTELKYSRFPSIAH